MTITDNTYQCSRCREPFPGDQLFAASGRRFLCTGCEDIETREIEQRARQRETANRIIEHLPHPVKDAPHLVVCACGETFRAVPAETTAMGVWGTHLSAVLTGEADQ